MKRLREIVEREAAAGPDDTETYAATDMEIHRTLAAAAGNRMIQALTDWIFEVLQPSLIEVLQPAIVQSAILEQHQALLAAVERGDPIRAERVDEGPPALPAGRAADGQASARGRSSDRPAGDRGARPGRGGLGDRADLAAAGNRVLGFDPVAPAPEGVEHTAATRPTRPRAAKIVLSVNSAAVALEVAEAVAPALAAGSRSTPT